MIDGAGRRTLYVPEHVLARSSGLVAEHRIVLFDAIGYGPHRCHWCDRWINWGHAVPYRLTVDHVDWNVDNNDLSNLVAACHGCNSKRHQVHPQYPPGGSPSLSAHPLLSSAVAVVAHKK